MSYKVLVVDDEASVRELFGELLRKDNHIVKTASNGEEALKLVEKNDFDVVLLDIKLGAVSGLDVLKMIKEAKPHTRVIMITGFGYDEELIARSKEYGCSGYIGKNMPISEIMNSFKLFASPAAKKIQGNK